MGPNYADFWAAFKATDAWVGLMSMALYSDLVELRLLRLRVEMLDAIAGIPNETDIQQSIWRLMELIGSSSEPAAVGELAGLMATHGLAEVYSLTP